MNLKCYYIYMIKNGHFTGYIPIIDVVGKSQSHVISFTIEAGNICNFCI